MALTPMMKQYFEVKERCKDAIVFFRLGDFYEMFFEDAEIASRELELVLTGRDCGLEKRAPMCGIPFHASQGYISKLVSKGFKVAICEQVEDPALAKGIVKRDIIKIVTPGTYTDSSFLEEGKNNFIMCIFKDMKSSMTSLAFADISTGEVYATEGKFINQDIFDEISKFSPSEIIYNENLDIDIIEEIKERQTESLTSYTEEYYTENAIEELKLQFKASNLEDSSIILLKSLSSLVQYLKYTQKNSLSHIDAFEYYDVVDYLVIDTNSRRNLELTESLKDKTKKGSLLSILDKTNTAMGARRLRKWVEQPLINESDIVKRQDAIENLVNNIAIHEDLKEVLRDIYDIERLASKISTKSVTAKELVSLKNSIGKIPRVKEILKQCDAELLKSMYDNLDDLQDIYTLLDSSIDDNPALSVKEGNIIKSGYNKDIDELREAKSKGKQWIASLEKEEKEVTGIKSLKVGYNKVFGYYLEVTKSNLSLVPDRYIRKQTLSNGERYITPELKEVEDKVLGAEEKLTTLEYDAFVEIRNIVETHIDRMKTVAKILSDIDCLSSLSSVSLSSNYVKPKINTKGIIDIKEGRHPVVEKLLNSNAFVENDSYIDTKDNQMLLITGPNMAGKSTYMRQVALITLMAQMGSFVPAREANISICDKIFTRIGASDDLASGKSTFMVEMWEVSNILKNATNKSLILLDEVGRGTSTYDGLSIAWAVIEYLCSSETLRAKTLFATHYHELIKLEKEIKGVKNYSVAVKEIQGEIVFLRKIVEGGTDESYGIEVAKLAGIPNKVIDRAREILLCLESSEEKKNIDKTLGTIATLEEAAIESDIKEDKVDIIETVNLEVTEKIKDENKKEKFKDEKKVTKSTSIQIDFSDLAKEDLIKELGNIDILSMNPMEGFNKLYELVNKAKNL